MWAAMNLHPMLLVWKNWKIDPHLKINKLVEISRKLKMGIE